MIWRREGLADVILRARRSGGGLPLSAALFVRLEFEALWEALGPEDVLTHTHVGSPLACAAALIVLDALPKLLDQRGRRRASCSKRRAGTARGCCGRSRGDWEAAWRSGVIVVPAGPGGIADLGDAPADDHRGRGGEGARAARRRLGLEQSTPKRDPNRVRTCPGAELLADVLEVPVPISPWLSTNSDPTSSRLKPSASSAQNLALASEST